MDKFYVITNQTKDEKYEVTKAIKKIYRRKRKEVYSGRGTADTK